jgi:4-hydroxy-tetrahydrodipicolinate synthase
MQTNHSSQLVSQPGGLWLPIITPFLDGRLDTASFERLVNHYLGAAIDGVIVAATTGECLTLSMEEIEELVAIAASVLKTRIPLFLGLSGSDTASLQAKIGDTSHWPIDGYLVSCPSYSRPSQAGLYAHFAELAGATGRPVMLYNIPYRTGVNLGNETLLELAKIPNIIGLKDCCADAAQTFDILRHKPVDFSLLTGEDAHYYSALVHGAEGAILASAHVETARFKAVHDRVRAGDQLGALAQWREIVDLTRLLFAEPSPAGLKHWLWREGLIASPEVRLPMTGVSDALAERIDAEIARTKVMA